MASTTTSPAPQKKKRAFHVTRGQARFAFLALLLINILNYADRSVISAAQVYIKADFHLSDTQLGLLTSSFLFIYGLATLPLGVWADRGVRKNIIAICVTIWSIATGLGGITQNFVQLFLTRSVLGVGEAGYAPASLSLIGDYFPRERRGRVLSIWSVSNLIGTALGLAIGGVIAQHFGWRWIFYIVGIPGLLSAFLIWRAVEPQRGAFDRDEDQDDGMAGHGDLSGNLFEVLRKLTHTPTYWILIAAFICSFFIVGAALAWIPTYLIREFSLKAGQASLIASGVLAGGSIVGTLAGGWIADTLQRRRPQGRMLVATVAFLVGAPLTWLALSLHSLSGFLIVFVIAIVFLSLCLGPIQAIIQDITLPELRSSAVGIALLLAHLLGDASSPIIIGAISDRTSLGFALQVTAAPCLFLAGLLCLLGLRTVARDMRHVQEQLRRAGK